MIKNKKQTERFFGIYKYLCILVLGLLGLTLGATSSVGAVTSDIARWYLAEQPIGASEIVSIKNDKADYVERAVNTKETKLLGITAAEGESLLSIDQKNEGVQVAIAGRSQVKVNVSNGPINRGDLIGLSATPGVGAKAEDGKPVVGTAEASFNPSGSEPGESILPVVISVGVAPSTLGSTTAGAQSWLTSLAGNDVSALQLAFVFFIAAVGFVTIVVLTYSSAKNGVVAVGRNPLAKQSILGALSQAMVMVTIVAISCFSLMYFMLRL